MRANISLLNFAEQPIVLHAEKVAVGNTAFAAAQSSS
jgi:hypothetical protein